MAPSFRLHYLRPMKNTSSLLIRAAEPGDAPTLTAMANLPGVRHGTLQLPFEPNERLERRLAAGSSDRLLVGMIKDGADSQKIVMHGGILPCTRRRAHVAEVILIVHDDHVGRGYGSAMLGALLDLADNWLGLRRLELEVNVDNASAIHLYQKAGFEIEGTKRGDVLRAGILIDSHIMGRLREAPSRVPD